MHAYTELMTQRHISKRQRPREANDELRHGHRLHRLSHARLSQPMHPVAFGSSRIRAATARRRAPSDQVVRAG